jgi:hypothetical protein
MRTALGILKWLLIAVVVILLLIAALPWIAVFQDQGGKDRYAAYLRENRTVLDIGEPDGKFAFDPRFYERRVILLSEMHGYRAVQALDMALLRHLNETTGLRTYLAELSPAQAIAFNIYLAGGDDSHARRVFDRWAEETAQWGNREFFAKLGAIRALNETLPVDRRIWFLGVDQIYDRAFAEEIAGLAYTEPSPGFGSIDTIQQANLQLLRAGLGRDEGASRYTHILGNIDVMLTLPGAREEQYYGLWGLFHGSKVAINGSDPLAKRLNGPDGPFAGEVGVITTVCADGCFNMMPAVAVPGPMKGPDGEPYSLIPMNYDDVYLARLRGIDALKEAAGTDRLVMFDLDAPGTPFAEGDRLVKASGYLPSAQSFDYAGPAADAFDYIILMRGSAALTPWAGAAHDVTGGNAAAAGIPGVADR